MRTFDVNGREFAFKTLFVELAEKRGFNRVSVQDIARQAMINRATFYRYYRDKYYLAEDILKSALSRMDVAIGPRIIQTAQRFDSGLC